VGINPDFTRPFVERLKALRAREARVKTSQRDRYVRDVCICDHGRQSLKVRIGGSTHSPPIRPVVAARLDKMQCLAPLASTTDTPTLPGGISSLISAQIGPSGIAARASRTSRIESSNSATRTSTRAQVSPATCVAI